MSSLILEVRAIEERGGNQRPGTYIRAGHVFSPGWDEYVVDEEILETLQTDPWLEVRVLDERTQAAKMMAAALAAEAEVEAEELAVKAKREKVNAVKLEAQKRLDAVAKLPPLPPPPEPATPFQDALMAAMPAAERAKLDPKSAPKKK